MVARRADYVLGAVAVIAPAFLWSMWLAACTVVLAASIGYGILRSAEPPGRFAARTAAIAFGCSILGQLGSSLWLSMMSGGGTTDFVVDLFAQNSTVAMFMLFAWGVVITSSALITYHVTRLIRVRRASTPA